MCLCVRASKLNNTFVTLFVTPKKLRGGVRVLGVLRVAGEGRRLQMKAVGITVTMVFTFILIQGTSM